MTGPAMLCTLDEVEVITTITGVNEESVEVGLFLVAGLEENLCTYTSKKGSLFSAGDSIPKVVLDSVVLRS